jgi:cysteine desulfurase/selenocysteine lyase
VPWQLLQDPTRHIVFVAPIDATGGLDVAAYEALLSPRTRLVAMTHLANATGALVPIETVTRLARRYGAKVLIDGCQAAPRLAVDVQALDCDFYTFSGHKTYGPTGIGVLYGRYELLSAMPPWQGGGEMILSVALEKSEFQISAPLRGRHTGHLRRDGLGTAIDSPRNSGATIFSSMRKP